MNWVATILLQNKMEQTILSNQNILLPRGGAPGARGRDQFLSVLISMRAIAIDRVDEAKKQYQDAEAAFDGLLSGGVVDEEKLTKAYAYYMKARFTDLQNIDNDVLEAIPYRLAANYLIAPYGLSRRLLRVAVARPTRIVRHELSVLGEIAQRAGKVEVGFTTTDAVQKALSHISGAGTPALKGNKADLPTATLSDNEIAPEAINKLPLDVMKKYQIIIFDEPAPGRVKMGVVGPDDKSVQEMINSIAHENKIAIDQYQITPDDFQKAIDRVSGTSSNPAEAPQDDQALPSVSSLESNSQQDGITLPDETARATQLSAANETGDTNLDKSVPEKITAPADIQKVVGTNNVPQILGAIMKYAAQLRASDIHIEAQKDKVVVRYRVDGLLQDIISIPEQLQQAIVARVKIIAKLKIDETRIPQDGRFDLMVNGHDVDVRVSIMPTVFGEKVVLRLLDKNAGLFKMESLGMTGENYRRFIVAIEKPYGVVMVTGPTGAGKSTTLYAAINHLRRPSINIVTLEDPVEYEIPGINQIQIKPNIGFTFAEGLGAVLRQDPNIIMVGEIRDVETANLVTHASLTGHLVLTTLHTNDASGAMPRLVNMGVEPFLIASSMNAIVGQRLVRKICEKCRVEIEVPAEVRAQVEKELSALGIRVAMKFYHGKGCSACGNTGFSGRTGIYEVYSVDDGMEQLIIARASADKIRDYATRDKMFPMRIDGFLKAIAGITTIDEVMHATAVN